MNCLLHKLFAINKISLHCWKTHSSKLCIETLYTFDRWHLADRASSSVRGPPLRLISLKIHPKKTSKSFHKESGGGKKKQKNGRLKSQLNALYRLSGERCKKSLTTFFLPIAFLWYFCPLHTSPPVDSYGIIICFQIYCKEGQRQKVSWAIKGCKGNRNTLYWLLFAFAGLERSQNLGWKSLEPTWLSWQRDAIFQKECPNMLYENVEQDYAIVRVKETILSALWKYCGENSFTSV